jgi:hypothetical protein
MKPGTTPDERIRAVLMRRIADRLGAPATCPARACRRGKHCNAAGGSELPCRRAACPEDQARFDQLLATVEGIRNLTLWPEPSRSDELRAIEAMAIEILGASLPLMPDFAPKYEAWLKRYNTLPSRPGDTRFMLKLMRDEIARYRQAARLHGI